MAHNSSIDTDSIHQQEVIPGFRSWLDLSRMRFLISSMLLVSLNSTGKGERFHFDMPYVDLAALAIDKRQGGLYGIGRDTNFACPNISSTPGNEANNALLPLCIHNPIDDLVQCAVTTISYNEIVILLSSPSCQFHTMPTILFNGDVGLPAGCR